MIGAMLPDDTSIIFIDTDSSSPLLCLAGLPRWNADLTAYPPP